ncbi:hypothetical protein ACFVMC_24885 [Nocardia sp. NPDC127579]|uniref:wHTH domain-containing protein n=1 Tax=Nocardia sp. NPDC127579 TaxID=3345402 RepID=UPI00362DA4DF
MDDGARPPASPFAPARYEHTYVGGDLDHHGGYHAEGDQYFQVQAPKPKVVVRKGATLIYGAPPGRSSGYRELFHNLIPACGLRGRDGELQQLTEFSTGTERYMCWSGAAGVGKTALLAEFVIHPPRAVDVVAYFATLAERPDGTEFLTVLADQLAEYVGRPARLDTAKSMPAPWALQLPEAALHAKQRKRNLVVVVDGLDQALTAREIGSLLPEPNRVPENVRFILTFRTRDFAADLLPAMPWQVLGRSADPEAQRNSVRANLTERWQRLVREHPVWQLLDPAESARGGERAAQFTAHLVRTAVDHVLKLGGHRGGADPWLDSELPERVSRISGGLTDRVFAAGTSEHRPTWLEAAVVATFPIVLQVFRLHGIAEFSYLIQAPAGTDNTVRSLHLFAAESYPRLFRRAWEGAPDRADEAAAIRWWILHQWLNLNLFIYEPGYVAVALRLESGTAQLGIDPAEFAEQIAKVIRLHRESAQKVPWSVREQHPQPNWYPLVDGDEEQVRLRLLSIVLVVAHRLALDPAKFPETVADHLGIPNPVGLEDIPKCARESAWRWEQDVPALAVRARHPALSQALRDQAEELAILLRGCRESAAGSGSPLAPLLVLPPTVSVQFSDKAPDPAADSDLSYFKFRVSDDRVRELLMGTQLYGDPALAIRELYQNSLDACRFRDRRLRYLRERSRKHAIPPIQDGEKYRGEIDFRQQRDDSDGRIYLTCRDNGVGMGYDQLVNSFAQAGRRFTDLPGYFEEMYEWSKSGIDFYPNSRFGIGVLSYFMLADEITLYTCRMHADGTFGSGLEVIISGPDSLVQIRRIPYYSGGPGTTVRLKLRRDREDVRCTDLLRRVLWVSEFDVTAEDGSESCRWQPGILADTAYLGVKDVLDPKAEPEDAVDRVHGSDRVWWCHARGAILADGLWTGRPLFGAVVNLTGRDVPPLTVDRRSMEMRSVDERTVRALLQGAVPTLTRSGLGDNSLDWLYQLARKNPELADEIGVQVRDADGEVYWRIAGREIPVSRIGCFPGDSYLAHFSNVPSAIPKDAQGKKVLGPGTTALGDRALAWRFSSWIAAGLIDGLCWTGDRVAERAVPTDRLIVQSVRTGKPVRVHKVLKIALKSHYPPSYVVARLARLGIDVVPANYEVLDDSPRSEMRKLLRVLSKDLDVVAPWLSIKRKVSTRHIIAAASGTGCSAVELVHRLDALGFRIKNRRWAAFDVIAQKFGWTMLFELGDVELAPLRPSKAIRPGQMISIAQAHAAQLNTSDPREQILSAAQYLTQAGYQIEQVPWEHAWSADPVVLSADLDAQAPWLSLRRIVPAGHVLAAAAKIGSTPEAVAGHLGVLGFAVDRVPWERTCPADTALLDCRSYDRNARWLQLDSAPVPAGQILALADTNNRRPADVAARLTMLGYDIEESPWSDPRVTNRILSLDYDHSPPWRRRTPSDADTFVPHMIAMIAHDISRSCAETTEILTGLGYRVRVPRSGWPSLDQADHQTLDTLGQSHPWGGTDLVRLETIAICAQTHDRSPRDIANSLRRMGFQIPDLRWKKLGRPADARNLHDLIAADLHAVTKPIALADIVFAAMRLNQQPREIADLLERAGVRFSQSRWPELAATDRVLLRYELNRSGSPIDVGALTPGHIRAAAVTTRQSTEAVAARLAALGYAPGASIAWTRDWSHGDFAEESIEFDRTIIWSPLRDLWLNPDKPVPATHLLDAARHTSKSVGEVARRLTALGYRLPEGIALTDDRRTGN